jgi:hypothetical protein
MAATCCGDKPGAALGAELMSIRASLSLSFSRLSAFDARPETKMMSPTFHLTTESQ